MPQNCPVMYFAAQQAGSARESKSKQLCYDLIEINLVLYIVGYFENSYHSWNMLVIIIIFSCGATLYPASFVCVFVCVFVCLYQILFQAN